jgi:hypothetical protein
MREFESTPGRVRKPRRGGVLHIAEIERPAIIPKGSLSETSHIF